VNTFPLGLRCLTVHSKCAAQVAYGVCAILSADNGEVYGITWIPNGIPDALQLPMLPGPRANCYNVS
jgi:hypothetical protein